MSEPVLILPTYYGTRIVGLGESFGLLEIRRDLKDGIFVVDGFTSGRTGTARRGGSRRVESLAAGRSPREPAGVWYRSEPELHVMGMEGQRRAGALPLEEFLASVDSTNVTLPRDAVTLAVTYCELQDGLQDWRAWLLSPQTGRAQLTEIQVVDEAVDMSAGITGAWPSHELASSHVVVIGCGSIGSHANDALADYGIRNLSLVDPERLREHNFSRHRASPADLGRRKVDAERDRLVARYPDMNVEPYPVDVIYDADRVRAILRSADAALVSTDGVDPRRAANHLTRRASVPTVFACVLEDGAYGEILRVNSPARGCLLCCRAALYEDGAMNPESALDSGYGTGSRHLPMTAVRGDLALMGALSAKVVVASLLQRRGHRDQVLAGEHAIVGLRPMPGLAAPFDIALAGEIRWHDTPRPRPDCPTCAPVT